MPNGEFLKMFCVKLTQKANRNTENYKKGPQFLRGSTSFYIPTMNHGKELEKNFDYYFYAKDLPI